MVPPLPRRERGTLASIFRHHGGTVRGPLDHHHHNKQGLTAVWSCSW